MKLHPDSNPMASFTVPNLGQFCYKKLFFVIVHSASKDEHLKHLQIIFDKPNEYGIIINPKKCIFEKTTVCYLGHLLSENGISPQPDKIKAVRGFFVTHHFSKITVLFRTHQLLPHSRSQAGRSGHALDLFLQKRFHKRSKIPWTPEAEKAFHDTKLVLADAVMLAYPLKNKTMTIYDDASDDATGACLHQKVSGTWIFLW